MASDDAAAGRARVTIENVNVPGRTTTVDAAMYHAMRAALLDVLPETPRGLTQAEVRSAVLPHLPGELYPAGVKAGWWSKAVQLDLEAKGLVIREDATPLRWHRATG